MSVGILGRDNVLGRLTHNRIRMGRGVRPVKCLAEQSQGSRCHLKPRRNIMANLLYDSQLKAYHLAGKLLLSF